MFEKKDKRPKLYEYFGLIILFYSQEHEPIHVHGKLRFLAKGKESDDQKNFLTNNCLRILKLNMEILSGTIMRCAFLFGICMKLRFDLKESI